MKKISRLWYIAGALIALRLLLVLVTPPGFFLDEAATGAHVMSMLHGWTNAHGDTWPLFSESLGGGYTTPIYLYPLTLWAVLFGPSELSLRYFSAVVTILAAITLGCAVKLWIHTRAGLIAAVSALALPWGWLQGSLAWDPALVPLLVALALVFFSRLLKQPSATIKHLSLILLPMTLIALAYLYPPMRVTAPLLFAAAYIVLLKKHIIGIRGLLVTCVGSGVLAIPLALFMFQPEALGRSQALSVFHDTSLIHGLWLALLNFIGLINPVFLFASGDPNLRHSTGFQGMLGVAAVPPLLATLIICIRWIRRQKLPTMMTSDARFLLVIGIYGILASLLGSALTNEGQPHSLRATGAWVFLVLLIAVGWLHILSLKKQTVVKTISFALAIIATGTYALDFSTAYPDRSAESFDVPQREAIYRNQPTPGYPDLARRYYDIR